MSNVRDIELVDACLYAYVTFGCINIQLCVIFLFIVLKNWQNASVAVNPSQYKLRNKYVISLIITIISNLVHALMIVFGITNWIVPWDYNTLPYIYQQVLIFFLCVGAFSFMCWMWVSFFIRISILYKLNKIQSIILNSSIVIILLSTVIMSIMLSVSGINLGHFRDESSGISILRPLATVLKTFELYIFFPLSIFSLILFFFIYSYKMKSLKEISTKTERDWVMPTVLKESILVITACSVPVVFGFCVLLIGNDNIILLCTAEFCIMLLCTFFMFDFNNKIFYNRYFCYYPSLLWLTVCCFHAKDVNDKQLLSGQSQQTYDHLRRDQLDDIDNDAEDDEDLDHGL